MTPRSEVTQMLLVALRDDRNSIDADGRKTIADLIEHQDQLLEVAIDRLVAATGKSFADVYYELIEEAKEKFWK